MSPKKLSSFSSRKKAEFCLERSRWGIWMRLRTQELRQTSLDAKVISLKVLVFPSFSFEIFFVRVVWDFPPPIWVRFDLVVYQVSTFYYVWNWSKSLLWWVLKATLVFIFGPNLTTLLWPRPSWTIKNVTMISNTNRSK